jgi:hypothetical protein
MISLRLQNLRETNQRLKRWLETVAAPHERPVGVNPEYMSALLSELLRAGTGLRSQPLPARGDDPEFDRELAEYRGQVERLREILPSMHTQLLAERARIEAQRARVRSAAEWARASRQTL